MGHIQGFCLIRQHASWKHPLIHFSKKIGEVLNHPEKSLYNLTIFIDLKKAFDTVNHKILVRKLNHYGIRGLPLKLIESYLSNRKQYVYINATASNLLSINMGVPQGSTLGPLLFLIYINDLLVVSTLTATKLFADDTCLLFSADNLTDLQIVINSEMKKIEKWMAINK